MRKTIKNSTREEYRKACPYYKSIGYILPFCNDEKQLNKFCLGDCPRMWQWDIEYIKQVDYDKNRRD